MNKFQFRIFFGLILIAAVFLNACDKIEAPYKENLVVPDNPGDSTAVTRKVLLEDYTGFYCGTCPPAAEIAASLDSIYGERLVIVAVHANFFADVSLHSAPYNSPDLRTSAGEEYYTFFGVSSNPVGMVNRTPVGGNHILSKDAWGTAIAQALNDEPELGIKLIPQYNATDRKLNLTAEIKYLKPGSEYDKLVLMLTETPIIAAQKDYRLSPSDILNYSHKHVLRANINGTWGDLLNTAAVPAGTSLTKTYTYTLPAQMDPDNIHIVGFVQRQLPDSQSDIKRAVIQVEEVSLK